ncbi:MAG TPA: hypothetical protein VJX69_13390 [Terriglobales bacterium]|nr:hypothetical protein [Terriglobales bacterium]
MPNGTKRWTIEIDKARFDKLKSEERFWQLVALARAVNTMRFVQTALLAQAEESDSLQAKRTKFNSFFFTCALLYEAIRLVERMGKYFHQVPAFGPLHEILKDPTATELRNSNLNPLRNQLTFHFFEKEIGAQLIKNDANPRFVTGQGETNADVYYELADVCTLEAFSGLQLNQPGATGKFGEQAKTATDLAVRFVEAAENLMNKVLIADGWELRE